VKRLVVVALLTPLGALLPGTAHAQAPDATGWWSATHRTGAPLAPPAPPDVAPGDLLLQGGDVQRNLPGTAPAPTAYAALRYAVPEGASVTALTLTLASGAQATDVRAYPTTTTWQPAEDGAIEDAPPPDLSRVVPGELSADGTTLTFPDIGKLASDSGVLSVALVPGVADRLVVLPPTATALTVTEPDVTAPPGPVVPAPVVAPVLPGLTPAPGVVAPVAPVGPVVPQVAPRSVVPGPVLPARPVSAAATVRRIVGDDGHARMVVLLEALLLTAFFGLLGHGPLGVLGRLTGGAEPERVERGLGRFRAARDGSVPRL
jgi:hypothetical protein